MLQGSCYMEASWWYGYKQGRAYLSSCPRLEGRKQLKQVQMATLGVLLSWQWRQVAAFRG